MTIDLSSILSKPASEVLPPKPLPNGIYLAQVLDYEFRPEVGQKKNPMIEFELNIVQPVDVEPTECELPKKLRLTQWLTDASLFRFKEFLEVLGIEGGQRTMMEMLPESKGRMCRVEIIQKPYTPAGSDTPQMINEVKKTFRLED